MVLEIINLCKKNYFNNLQLNVDEKEIVNIISADKTKLDVFCKTILNLVSYDGSINLFNHSTKKESLKALKFIGYTSTLKYKSNQKIIDYLKLTSKFYDVNYTDNILSLLKEFELEESKKMEDLNDYERDSLTFIKAVLHNPKLVIINGLLNNCSSKCKTIIKDIVVKMKSEGTSFIITSDHLALDICTDIYLLDESLRDFNNLNNMYKIEIPNIKDFNIKELKQTPLNLNINNEVISFIVTKDFNETLKYLASLRPAFINIQRPYIGEIFNEALPTL